MLVFAGGEHADVSDLIEDGKVRRAVKQMNEKYPIWVLTGPKGQYIFVRGGEAQWGL